MVPSGRQGLRLARRTHGARKDGDAVRRVLLSLGLALPVIFCSLEAVYGHPIYAGGKDNGVRILSHANTDFKAVDGAAEGGKVRTYMPLEAHGGLEAKGTLTKDGKDVALAEDVSTAEGRIRVAEGEISSLNASVASAERKAAGSVAALQTLVSTNVSALQCELTETREELAATKAELNATKVSAAAKIALLSPPECDWRFTARQEFVRGKWRCVCGYHGRLIPDVGVRYPLKSFSGSQDDTDFHGVDCSKQRGPVASIPSSTKPSDVTHRIPLEDGRIFAFSNLETAGRNPTLYEIDAATLEVKNQRTGGRPGFYEASENLEKYNWIGGCPHVHGGRNQLAMSTPVAQGTKLYFVGGQKMHVYDVDAPELAFLDLGPLPAYRHNPAAAFFGTKLYVAGGVNVVGAPWYTSWCDVTWTPHSTIIVYDTAAETKGWITLPSKLTLNKGVSRMAWCSDATRLYLLGGRRNAWKRNSYTSSAYFDADVTKFTSAMVINSEDDVVSSLPSMPEGREWFMPEGDSYGQGSACAIVGDAIYVGGGVYSYSLDAYWTDHPHAGTTWWPSAGVATGTIMSFNLTSQTWTKESSSSALDHVHPLAGPTWWRTNHGSNNPSVSSYGKAAFASLMTVGNRLWMTVSETTGGLMYEPGWTPSPQSAES